MGDLSRMQEARILNLAQNPDNSLEPQRFEFHLDTPRPTFPPLATAIFPNISTMTIPRGKSPLYVHSGTDRRWMFAHLLPCFFWMTLTACSVSFRAMCLLSGFGSIPTWLITTITWTNVKLDSLSRPRWASSCFRLVVRRSRIPPSD